MFNGPGKYDELCTDARMESKAEGAVLIIFDGKHGDGFAAAGGTTAADAAAGYLAQHRRTDRGAAAQGRHARTAGEVMNEFEAMAEIDENILALWFVSLPDGLNSGDWLASLHRMPGADTLILNYRFRWYETEGAWDGLDRKSMYRGTLTASVNEAIDKVSNMSRIVAQQSGSERWELIRGKMPLDEFERKFTALPFVHSRTISEEEAKARGLIP